MKLPIQTNWYFGLAVMLAMSNAGHANGQMEPHVFVSSLTRAGLHSDPKAFQYRFDRALERAVAEKYVLVPSNTKPALLGKYMKSDGYFWIGGSGGYGCGLTCKASFTYSAYAAHSAGTVEHPLRSCDIQEPPEQCAREAAAYLDDVIRQDAEERGIAH